MHNILPGIISYILSGWLLLVFFMCRERYESARKFRCMIGQLTAVFFITVAVAFIVVSCCQATVLTIVQAGWIPIFLVGMAGCLFIGAILVELNNPPERYSIRRRHIKYALQSMSGGVVMLLLAVILLRAYGGIPGGESITFINVYPPLFITVLLMASSEFFWKGGRYLVWAYRNSGALKEGGKDMKLLRKSIRR